MAKYHHAWLPAGCLLLGLGAIGIPRSVQGSVGPAAGRSELVHTGNCTAPREAKVASDPASVPVTRDPIPGGSPSPACPDACKTATSRICREFGCTADAPQKQLAAEQMVARPLARRDCPSRGVMGFSDDPRPTPCRLDCTHSGQPTVGHRGKSQSVPLVVPVQSGATPSSARPLNPDASGTSPKTQVEF
jgi:hypothetical protein